MELKEVIETRRTVRKFKDIAIPDFILNEMLESARLAPSGGNAQGHVFGVIKDQKIKDKLALAAGEQMWIASAPIVFACCARLDWDIAKQPEENFGLIVNKLRFDNSFLDYLCMYPSGKARMTLFENATPLIPAEHIFLTAVSHGLSACFVGYLDIPQVDGILGLPEDITCLYLLPVGYPDETPKPKHRK
ncbi:MAG: nitroreductase family protein, partial [Erysipelotrichaceae bacterium]